MHPKQRDKKQSRFGQPPAHIVQKSLEECVEYRVYLCACVWCVVGAVCVCDHADEYTFSLKVTGVVSPDAWRSQLLHQDADHIDEDNEVHLQANK